MMTTEPIWQNHDGTWSHHKDSERQWISREACQIDLRFHLEWGAA